MSRRGRPGSFRAGLVMLIGVLPMLAVGACSSAGEPATQGAPATAPAPASTPEQPPAPAVSPFTGLPTDLKAPVLGVKIDNAPPARPQSGLAVADLVYVEPVEGGVSRLLAVFQSRFPPVVGPVRSARQSDLQVLAAFGRPALGFSGEAAALRPMINAAPLLDVSAQARPGAYHRDYSRPAPHNLYADTAPLRAGGAPPQDIGFHFGPPPPGGEPAPSREVRYRSARIGLEWAPAERRWLVNMDGAPLTTAAGQRPGAATVVLQRVVLRNTNIVDAAGAPSPFAETVGQGDAVVLRDGRAYAGHWSRPAPNQGTTFTLPGGAPLPFAPGPVWIVLVPA